VNTEGLGVNVEAARAAIARADLDKARGYANTLLDELIEARRYIVKQARIAERGDPTLASVGLWSAGLWASAVTALRELASKPDSLIRNAAPGDDRVMAVRDAADWLEDIGPTTTKLPCDTCLKPTDKVCGRCGRYLCTRHISVNLEIGAHPGGVGCVI
jgi:hypothetical protein